MAKKKTKKVYKKAPTRAQNASAQKSRTLSFVIGVVTVLILGFLIFIYSRMNNYTQVMGAQSQNSLNALGE